MIETRWKLMGCAVALLPGLLLARPAAAASDCGVAWSGVWMTADINGDEEVDGVDLGLVLSQWGDCPGCATDFNRDGRVNCVDEGLVLGSWGLCPPPPVGLDNLPGVTCDDLALFLDSLTACTVAGSWREVGYQGFPLFDVDSSGTVDERDAHLVECLRGSPPGTVPSADVNRDQEVDAKDLQLVIEAAGRSCYDPNQDGFISWPDIYVLIGRWQP